VRLERAASEQALALATHSIPSRRAEATFRAQARPPPETIRLRQVVAIQQREPAHLFEAPAVAAAS
jgi:hypothetical protein